MTLEEFQKELGQVDFFYEYLDDHCQYMAAADKYHRVRQLAKCNPEFEKLFNQRNPLI